MDLNKLNISVNRQVFQCVWMENGQLPGPTGTWSLFTFLGSCDAQSDGKHSSFVTVHSLQWPTVALAMVPWLQCPAGQRDIEHGDAWSLPGLRSIQPSESQKDIYENE